MSHKNEADLSYTVPGLSVVYPPCRFCVYGCLYVFPACPGEMLLTQWLKTGRLPVLTGSVLTLLFHIFDINILKF